MKTKIYATIILLCLLVISVFSINYLTSHKEQEYPNIILISIESTPKYTWGAYGYERNITPNIDNFSKKAVVFENHISQAPWTFPSMSAFMTSSYPSEIGIKDVMGEKLSNDILTLAEVLKNNGYHTAGAVAVLPLREKFGINQGFDEYYFVHRKFRAKGLTDKAIDILENSSSKENTFLWLHYFEPHCPYNAPEPYKNKYVEGYEGNIPTDCKTAWKAPSYYKNVNMSSEDAQFLKNRQDGEIEYNDKEVGRLFRYLKENNIFNSSIIILTADHGEEFFEHEHKFIGHGIDFYDTVINVPLMIKFPNQTKEKRINKQTRHIDIFPTLIDVLGIEVESSLSGTSLVPIIQGKEKSLPAYSEFNGVRNFCSLRYNKYKLISGGNVGVEGRYRLYNLSSDPNELENLAETKTKLLEGMKENLKQIQTQIEEKNGSEEIELSEEMKKGLEELGYVE